MTEADHFRVAGGVVRVEWEDAALRTALARALAHRRVAATAPGLRLRATTRGGAWPAAAAGELLVDDGVAGLAVLDPTRRIAHRINAAGTEAEFVCEEPDRLQGYECAAPFQLILQRWLGTRGVQMLHGGGVGVPEAGAVLFAARGGGGKSNTMLACLGTPLHLLGEDYVAVDAGGPAPQLWSLYNTAKLHPADIDRFPELAGDVDPVRDPLNDKLVLQLGRRDTARWAEGLPLRAILVLRVTGRPATRIVPAPPAEAMKELLTSPLMLLPHVRRPLFEFVARFVRTPPVYRLELGTERGQIAGVIHEFLTSPPR